MLRNLTVVKQYLQTLESIGEIDWQPVPPKRSERVMMRAASSKGVKNLCRIFSMKNERRAFLVQVE